MSNEQVTTAEQDNIKINQIHDSIRSVGFIRGLRALADFLEANPSVPTPSYGPYFNVSSCSKEQLQAVLTAQGKPKVEKNYWNESFSLKMHFAEWEALRVTEEGYRYNDTGNTTITFTAQREEVCERVVTGTKIIPREVIPERVVEEHEEEIVEWKCKPLLGPDSREEE